jgi:hypothetical protein
MVQEIEDGAVGHTGPRQPSVRGINRERWGEIYNNMPVRRMVALYDYDPQELSPNVDAEVSEASVCVFLQTLIFFFFHNLASGIEFSDRPNHPRLR